MLGGRLGDWRLMPSVVGLAVALVATLLALVPASAGLIPATAVIGLWVLPSVRPTPNSSRIPVIWFGVAPAVAASSGAT
jgi:hypothetical protein